MGIRRNVLRLPSKIFIIALLSISQIIVTASCAVSRENSSGSGGVNSSSANITSSSDNSTGTIKSGTLRLWMQPPVTFNPLISTQYQWNQISHLFYESLFHIGSRQELTADLADKYSISGDGLTYRIDLKDKVLFHDNTAFDSQDVLSTIQFIQNQTNRSIYFDQLVNISSVTIIDDLSLEIKLSKIDPFFLYDLNFPVLSSEAIDNTDIAYQPGTGLYKIMSYEKGNLMKAALFSNNRNSKDCRIKTINILELEDTRDAMQAFGDDKVDMVSLKDSSYDTYYLRNDMKIIRYPGNKFIFFEMNQPEGALLKNTEKSDFIKSLILKSSLLDGFENIFISKAQIPVLSTSIMIHQIHCEDVLNISTAVNPFKPADTLKIIYTLGDMVKELLISELGAILKLNGIDFVASGYESAKFNDIIKEGDYDLALREATLGGNPDPSWLYLPASLRLVKDIETINKSSSVIFTESQTYFQQMYAMPDLQINAENFCGVLNKLARNGPFIGLGFRINGIILSKRIKGRIDSNSFNQYNDIKDVWVWSGQ